MAPDYQVKGSFKEENLRTMISFCRQLSYGYENILMESLRLEEWLIST